MLSCTDVFHRNSNLVIDLVFSTKDVKKYVKMKKKTKTKKRKKTKKHKRKCVQHVQKLLFLLIKYANSWRFSCLRCRYLPNFLISSVKDRIFLLSDLSLDHLSFSFNRRRWRWNISVSRPIHNFYTHKPMLLLPEIST